MKGWLILLLTGLASWASGQQANRISLGEYLAMVRAGHPLMRQAETLPALADAELQQARGAFDPVLSGGFSTKQFQGTNYYEYQTAMLKVPVWSGVELKAGYENAFGTYLNSESQTPANGLVYAGVSLPVGRGLVLDERRNAVQLAAIGRDISEAERLKLANKVMADAAKTWWLWWEAYQRWELLRESVELAEVRMEGIRESIRQGDRPVVDSVEAYVEILKRKSDLGEGRLELTNAVAFASAYLWDTLGKEIVLTLQSEPVLEGNPYGAPSEAEAGQWRQWSMENHPEIRKLALKQGQLTRERVLATQNLLPDIRLEFFPLTTAPPVMSEMSTANYKAGVSVYFPLLLRKERGKLQSIRIKQDQLEQSLRHQVRLVDAEVQASLQQVSQLDSLVDIQMALVEGARVLREAEVTLFMTGESSQFLVNRRERAWVEAQIKELAFRAKLGKAQVGYFYASGREM